MFHCTFVTLSTVLHTATAMLRTLSNDIALVWAPKPQRMPQAPRPKLPSCSSTETSHLKMLTPFTVERLTLKNRIIRMGAHEGLESDCD